MNTKERIEYLTKRLASVVSPKAKNEVQAALDLLKGEIAAPKRAHDEDGHFAADDPSTKDINEAWKSGKSPKKKKSKKNED